MNFLQIDPAQRIVHRTNNQVAGLSIDGIYCIGLRLESTISKRKRGSISSTTGITTAPRSRIHLLIDQLKMDREKRECLTPGQDYFTLLRQFFKALPGIYIEAVIFFASIFERRGGVVEVANKFSDPQKPAERVFTSGLQILSRSSSSPNIDVDLPILPWFIFLRQDCHSSPGQTQRRY